MRYWKAVVVGAMLGAGLAAHGVGAQVALPGSGTRLPRDARGNLKLQIKRETVSGTVKSVDTARKQLVLQAGKEKKAREVPVEVGPCVIKAGKGSATLADIQVGDKVRVFGEVTVQGGLRAMEITLPAERMSIPPAGKKKPAEAPAEKKPAEK
jgi:hypothetical protein